MGPSTGTSGQGTVEWTEETKDTAGADVPVSPLWSGAPTAEIDVLSRRVSKDRPVQKRVAGPGRRSRVPTRLLPVARQWFL